MGFTHVSVLVRPVGGTNGGGYEGQFLVDTGSIDSMAPAVELVRAGIKPAGTMIYELADGTEQEFTFGLAQIELLGTLSAGRVIFGPEGTEPILGVTALEAAGIIVDPVTQSLTRRRAIPLK
jgi:predicted aspartyl protease